MGIVASATWLHAMYLFCSAIEQGDFNQLNNQEVELISESLINSSQHHKDWQITE